MNKKEIEEKTVNKDIITEMDKPEEYITTADTLPKKRRGRPKKQQVQTVANTKAVESDLILSIPIEAVEKNTEPQKDTWEGFDIEKVNNPNKKIYYNKDDYIEQLKKKIEEQEKEIHRLKQTSIISISENKVINSELYLQFDRTPENNIDLTQKVHEVYCLWDTCKIDTDNIENLVFLPDRIENDTFIIIGVFCSISCAMSYNLRINDSRVNERFTLLKYLYDIKDNFKVYLSPDIRVLKKYGGNLSIEEYRNNLNKYKYTRLYDKTISAVNMIFEQSFNN